MIFFTYAFVNMGMVSGILPVVGAAALCQLRGTAMVTLGLALGILMSVARAQSRGAWKKARAPLVARCAGFWPGDALQAVQGWVNTLPRGCPEVTTRGVLSLIPGGAPPWRQSSSSRKRPTTSLFSTCWPERAGDLDQRDHESAPVPCRASNGQKHAPDDARFGRLSARNGAPTSR